MSKKLLIETNLNDTRIALLEDNELTELYIEDRANETISGNIYAGRVTNILPGIGAAFVDVGIDRNAFVYIGENKDASIDILEGASAPTSKRKLRIGDEVVVQIIKEPSGLKGAVASLQLSFPGKYIVMLPGQNYVGISKKITNSKERERLTQIILNLRPKGYAIIIRTSGEGKNEEDFSTEIKEILEQSQKVVENAQYIKATALIKKEVSTIKKAVRDLFSVDIDRLIVDKEEVYEEVYSAVKNISPDMCGKIVKYNNSIPLFEYYFIESQIEKALQKRVWLKSGGFLIIEQTEACVVIDVNSGKYSGKKNIDETILKINLEAAIEITKQIRLRNLSGMIIIDFIDMKTEADKHQVAKVLENETLKDRIKTVVVGFTELGLMQLTRKKTRKQLSRLLKQECDNCNGSGTVLNSKFVANKIRNQIEFIFGQTIFNKVEIFSDASVLYNVGMLVPYFKEKYCKEIILTESNNKYIDGYKIEKIN